VSNPGHDPAASWQQPPIVLTGSVPADGEDLEPPMWAQPVDGTAVVSAPIPASVVRRSRMDALFGRVLDRPGEPFVQLVVWGAAFAIALAALLLGGYWFPLALTGIGLIRTLVNGILRRSSP